MLFSLLRETVPRIRHCNVTKYAPDTAGETRSSELLVREGGRVGLLYLNFQVNLRCGVVCTRRERSTGRDQFFLPLLPPLGRDSTGLDFQVLNP